MERFTASLSSTARSFKSSRRTKRGSWPSHNRRQTHHSWDTFNHYPQRSLQSFSLQRKDTFQQQNHLQDHEYFKYTDDFSANWTKGRWLTLKWRAQFKAKIIPNVPSFWGTRCSLKLTFVCYQPFLKIHVVNTFTSYFLDYLKNLYYFGV